MAAGGRGLGPALLAEDVVRELAAPVLVHAACGDGGELYQGVAGQLAHARLGHRERVGDGGVVLAALEQQLDNGALLRGKLFERGHGRRTIG